MRTVATFGLSRLLAGVLLGLLLLVSSPAQAQHPAIAWERLLLELWPDYDRPEMLILLTGTLPPETPLPAVVTVPLPVDATLNAVARISATDGLIDDIPFERTGSTLSLTTPDAAFRVEYYQPFATDGEARQATFTFEPPVAVTDGQIRVQEPAGAVDFAVTPAVVFIAEEGGLRYHTVVERPLPAGESVAVTVAYRLPGGVLSAGQNAPAAPVIPPEPAGVGMTTWLLVVAVAVVVGLGAAGVVGRLSASAGSRPRRPRPKRGGTAVRFCRHCGQPVSADDQFCRACGEKL